MPAPKVMVVLVNWNAWPDTMECLSSCARLDYPNADLVVVDNGSSDESVARIRDAHPEARVITSSANLGFAGGNNLALRLALDEGYDYIWLLNNDTVVDPGALTSLIDGISAHATAGAAASKILYYSRPKTLWYAGGYFSKGGTVAHVGLDEVDEGQYDTPTETGFITGCSMLISARAARDVGVLDDDYFLYWEDAAYCMRLTDAGYSLLFAPGSVIWHKEGASRGGSQGRTKVEYLNRNMLRVYAKHAPRMLPRALMSAAHEAASHIRRGEGSLALGVASGVMRFLANNRGPIGRA